MRLSKLLVHSVSILALIAAAGCSTGKKKKYGGTPGQVAGTEDSVEDTDTESGDVPQIDPTVTFEPDRGLKTGSQLRNTLLTVSGIATPAVLTAIQTEYTAVETSLLLGNKMQMFDAGKQSSILKLAVRVCDGLITDATASAAFFPGVNFAALDATAQSTVSKTLVAKFWGAEVSASGMSASEAEGVLTKLQADLIAGGATGPNAAKGACAAAAASLPTLIL